MAAMSAVAIIGAGAGGAAIAHRLADRGRVGRIHLIDANAGAAAGKALDIQQAGPIGGSDVRLSGASDVLAAVGADVIVIADDTASGEWQGERGLALVGQLVRSGTQAPFVFAGAQQIELMEHAVREITIAPNRIVGTAAAGLANAVAALTAIEIGRSGVDVVIVGRPRSFVVAWSGATAGGSLVADIAPSHRLRTISNAVSRLWPPGPQTIAAPTAAIVEALIAGSRRLHQAVTVLDGELGMRGVAAMLPVELGDRRVLGRSIPTLSPVERTEMLTALALAQEGTRGAEKSLGR
jgi:malate dehydrogenase